tara:strand:- start:3420 stop:3596 length:177 start_codon:yes stop_codon:yes gene_type:complete
MTRDAYGCTVDVAYNRVMLVDRLTGYSQGNSSKIDVEALVDILLGLGATWLTEADNND